MILLWMLMIAAPGFLDSDAQVHRVKTVLALRSENTLKAIKHINLDSHEPWPQGYSSTILPYTVTTADCEANITAQTGLTASMFCCLGIVNKDLGISWVRKEENNMNILSHDSTLFTTDKRISVHFYPVSGIWELRISKVGVEDVGEYECQANTEPKREFSISLGVADTLAVISGPKEVFLKAGSQLRLHCVVDLGRGPDSHFHKTAVLHWFVNQRLIDPGAGREKNVRTSTKISNKFQGWIIVSNSTPSYSGNYSCVPSYTTPDWVMVHIIADDSPVGLLDVNGHSDGLGSNRDILFMRHLYLAGFVAVMTHFLCGKNS